MLNKVYNEDCLVTMAKMPENFVDLVVTSPPYDNLRDYHGHKFGEDFPKIATSLFRVLKPGGVLVWIVADETVNGSETGSSFTQALYFKNLGLNLHDTMIWNKGTFTAVGSLRCRYAPVFEYMFVLSKGFPKTFNPIKDKVNKTFGRLKYGTIRLPNGRVQLQSSQGRPIQEFGQRHNIWDVFPEKRNTHRLHPAMFSEQIAKDHILSWSNKGDTVYDPFSGSGTTVIASLQTGRKFIASEISAEYFLISENRITQFLLR